MGTSLQVCPITAGMINSNLLPLSRSEFFHDGISFFLWHVAMHWRHRKVCFPHFFCQPVNLWCHYKYYNIIGSEIPITWTLHVHEKFQSCWDSVQSRICWAVMGPLIWIISKQVPSVFSMKFQNGFKVLSHEVTCRRDMSLFLCNSTQRLVARIQISLNSCDTSWQQNVARTFRPLVWHALATCRCDNSVNKPIAGLPCDRRPWEKGLRTCRDDKSPRVTCMWFCRGDTSLRQVASWDRTFMLNSCNITWNRNCNHLTFLLVLQNMTACVMVNVSYKSHSVSNFHSSLSTATKNCLIPSSVNSSLQSRIQIVSLPSCRNIMG